MGRENINLFHTEKYNSGSKFYRNQQSVEVKMNLRACGQTSTE